MLEINNKSKLDIIKYLVPAIVLIFLIFLICKWSGLFDKSSKYGIKKIEATSFPEYVQFMIDDDEYTHWTNYFEYYEGMEIVPDELTFDFKKKTEIKSITMIGECPDSVEFYGKDDAGEYVLLGTVENIKEGGIATLDTAVPCSITLDEAFSTDSIKIKVGSNATIFRWLVQEIHFNE